MDLNYICTTAKTKQLMTLQKEELCEALIFQRAECVILYSKISEFESEIQKMKLTDVNKTTNQPTSKKAEFEKAAEDKIDFKKKKKRKKRFRGKRPGSGNENKTREPSETNHHPLDFCPECTSCLAGQPVIEETVRLVEDIPAPPIETIITEEICEKKWCAECKEVVSSFTEKALPKSDIGLNTLVLVAYMWVVSAMPFPSIKRFLDQFYSMKISTSGLSRMMIRLGDILEPVYNEILADVKGGVIIFADETGWSVKGVLHWLWAFANQRSAFYWIDRKRGSEVVGKILGVYFSGVLVTDAWCAYYKIICEKQTCLAHLFRKIRKLYETFPELRSLLKFMKKFRRIIMDGEKLQKLRGNLSEDDFERKFQLLKDRIDFLLAWPNPNPILKDIISKVFRQKDYLLTFVRHDGVPITNNFAEYIIKKGILKRKVSGGSMAKLGAVAYCRIISVAQTCHLRKLNFKAYLMDSLVHYIRTGTPLSLADFEASIQSISTVKAA